MAIESVEVISLDMTRPGVVTAHAKQYDIGRKVEAHLYSNGTKWYVPSSGFDAVVGYKKSIRNGGFYDATDDGETAVTVTTSDRSIITVILDRGLTTMATASGHPITVEISFYDQTNGRRISSFSFKLQVEEASVTELDLSENPQFSILGKQIKAVLDVYGPKAVVAVDSSNGKVQFQTVNVNVSG